MRLILVCLALAAASASLPSVHQTYKLQAFDTPYEYTIFGVGFGFQFITIMLSYVLTGCGLGIS
jgi:hypothetical protein